MTDLPADILERYNKLAQRGKCDEAPDPLTRDAHRLSVFRRVALTGKQLLAYCASRR